MTLALLRGAWTDLEARISELLELGRKTDRRDDADGVNGAQMFALNRDLGRLEAVVPELRKIAACADAHVWQPGVMLMLAETGMLAEAPRMFEGIAEQGFCAIERDDMYVTGLVFCAETCVALADAERVLVGDAGLGTRVETASTHEAPGQLSQLTRKIEAVAAQHANSLATAHGTWTCSDASRQVSSLRRHCS